MSVARALAGRGDVLRSGAPRPVRGRAPILGRPAPLADPPQLFRAFGAPGATVRPPELITVSVRDPADSALPVDRHGGRIPAAARLGAAGRRAGGRGGDPGGYPQRVVAGRTHPRSAAANPAAANPAAGRPHPGSATGNPATDNRATGNPATRNPATGRIAPRGPVAGLPSTARPAATRPVPGLPGGPAPRRVTRPPAPARRRQPAATHPGTTALGRRFLGALSLRPPDRDQPLPVQLRPLAQLVVGPQRAAAVRVRTGRATTEALAEAGRPAATVGNVVHLATPPSRSARTAEVVAHELVHAVRPSPVPRFFADDHDSPEERRAVVTGDLVRDLARKTDLASKTMEGGGLATALQRRVDAPRLHRGSGLTFGTAGLAVGPGASPLTAGALTELAAGGRDRSGAATAGDRANGTATAIRRSTGGPAPSGLGGTPAGGVGTPAGGVGTAGAGSRGGGTGAGDQERLLHRRRAGGRHRMEPPEPTFPPTLARLLERPPNPPFPGAGPDPGAPGGVPWPEGPGDPFSRPSTRSEGPMSPPSSSPSRLEQSTHPISQDTLDWIVEAVEERILAELERRGLRYQPGVF